MKKKTIIKNTLYFKNKKVIKQLKLIVAEE